MELIEKNTVEAKNQLRPTEVVQFEKLENTGLRVLFAGNSITLHGIKPEIGWHWLWGMAASAKEKDYVHRLIEKISALCPDAAYCIGQVSAWEVDYKHGEESYDRFKEASYFGADIIVMRFVENCPWDDFDQPLFERELKKMLDFLNSTGKAKIILTTGFWKHIADDGIRAVAAERGYPLVELGDLGELDEMKAVGLFEHTGVAQHPGDKGMEAIAERIFEVLRQYL